MGWLLELWALYNKTQKIPDMSGVFVQPDKNLKWTPNWWVVPRMTCLEPGIWTRRPTMVLSSLTHGILRLLTFTDQKADDREKLVSPIAVEQILHHNEVPNRCFLENTEKKKKQATILIKSTLGQAYFPCRRVLKQPQIPTHSSIYWCSVSTWCS